MDVLIVILIIVVSIVSTANKKKQQQQAAALKRAREQAQTAIPTPTQTQTPIQTTMPTMPTPPVAPRVAYAPARPQADPQASYARPAPVAVPLSPRPAAQPNPAMRPAFQAVPRKQVSPVTQAPIQHRIKPALESRVAVPATAVGQMKPLGTQEGDCQPEHAHGGEMLREKSALAAAPLTPRLSAAQLRQAVIFKEILDRPLSRRPRAGGAAR